MTPTCVQNSLLGWAAKGLPFVLAENRERAAQRIVEQFLQPRRTPGMEAESSGNPLAWQGCRGGYKSRA